MASYPCENCGTMVEITGSEYDLRCKKCGEKKPFKCSKCQKQIGVDDIYHPERLTFRKPIFCNDCGASADFVTCNQCTQTLMRANCVEKNIDGKPHYYHKNCYDDAIKMQNRIKYLAPIPLALIGAYVLHLAVSSPLMYLLGAIIGLVIAFKIAGLFAPK
ncbi:MAG: hypothetical protein Q4F00_00315 [bacterium]|nr:hypothetical protein [bacterium]